MGGVCIRQQSGPMLCAAHSDPCPCTTQHTTQPCLVSCTLGQSQRDASRFVHLLGCCWVVTLVAALFSVGIPRSAAMVIRRHELHVIQSCLFVLVISAVLWAHLLIRLDWTHCEVPPGSVSLLRSASYVSQLSLSVHCFISVVKTHVCVCL